MLNKSRQDIPIGMEKVYRRLESWRRTRRGRQPIPEPLWAAAAAVAREYGINRTSKVLHLEFKKLKGFAESGRCRKQTATRTPQFVELMTPVPATSSECVVELERRHGTLRIHWKGMTAVDVAELSRVLLEQA